MTHYHQFADTIADGLQRCRCGDVRIAPRPPAVYTQPTSIDAAAAIRPHTPSLRVAVYRLLRASGPMTDQQIQDASGCGPQTITPRRIELARAGLVRDTGRTAPTRAGRAAILWEAIGPVELTGIELGRLSRRRG